MAAFAHSYGLCVDDPIVLDGMPSLSTLTTGVDAVRFVVDLADSVVPNISRIAFLSIRSSALDTSEIADADFLDSSVTVLIAGTNAVFASLAFFAACAAFKASAASLASTSAKASSASSADIPVICPSEVGISRRDARV